VLDRDVVTTDHKQEALVSPAMWHWGTCPLDLPLDLRLTTILFFSILWRTQRHCQPINMAYGMELISITLRDLQVHSPTASLFKCNFYSAVQQLTRFQLTQCVARSLCGSW